MEEKWRETIWKNEKLRGVIEYFNGYGSPYDDLIIELVEKEISKRALNKRIRNEELIGSCPTCKMKWNVGYWEKYCSNCGQKLDWS